MLSQETWLFFYIAKSVEFFVEFRNRQKRTSFNNKQEAEEAWKLTTIKNQIFELILEQCIANYYGDNTIAK